MKTAQRHLTMWFNDLKPEEQRAVQDLRITLDLPKINEYTEMCHFLTDVHGRVVESAALAEQLAGALNSAHRRR